MKKMLLSLAALMSLISSAVFAQSRDTATNQADPSKTVQPSTPATSASSSSAPDDNGGIQEIIVTAQKRSERLQDVPIAVAAVSAEQLAAAGIQSTQDLSVVTPGLLIPQTSGYTQPHLRGIGTTSNGPGIENPVATYIDGVYIASMPGSLFTLNNVDRIEVLKGPQGTLFGRNSTGGLIQLVTKDPSSTPSGETNVSYGNYQDVAVDAYATGGLANDLSADIALRYEHQGEGFGRNLFDGRAAGSLDYDVAARTKFLFAPTDTTRIRLALDYEARDSTRDVQHLDVNYPTTFNNAFFAGPYPQGGYYDINYDTPFYNRFKGGGASLQISQEIGSVALQSITAYRESEFSFNIDLDLIPENLLSAQSTAKDSQFSQELQFTSTTSGPLKWVAGVYYFHARSGWNPLSIDFGPSPISPVPGVPAALVTDNHQTTKSYAGYAQATYEVLSNTNLTLGVRFTDEKKTVGGTESFVVGGATVATTPYPVPGIGIPTELTFSRTNYRIALDHKFTPDIMAYVSYNTGFKSGGFNLSSSTNAPYLPESIKAGEAGLKTELFDRHVRFNAAGFHYDYSNIQVQRYIANNITITNGAKAELYGADLDGQWLIIPNLSLNVGYSYIHARFNSFPNADYYYPIGGCVPVPGGVCSGSAAGKTLPYAPKTTFDVGGEYRIETEIGWLSANVTYFRSGEFFVAPDNFARQRAYGLANALLSWTDKSDHVSLKIWCKNIADTRYASSLLESSPGVDVVRGYPRTYGLTAGVKF